ncbi:MAG: glutathione S-transferase N-terminal domain-containing protein [Burkholderiaceae bacterium]|nr:glutathione S-transferase N-terminal domain-containing protein [Burkholderiaceae bacterium]
MLLLSALSPAPRALRMFLLEKGLSIPTRNVDVFTGENRKAPFLAHNPAGQTPALLLDDGSCISEAVAIMEYLEERHPTPALIGSTGRVPSRGVSPQPGQAEMRVPQRATAASRVGTVSLSV